MAKGKLKVVSVFGTRPETIKLAPVITQLKKYPDNIDSRVVVTAQHREMLDQVLTLFDIRPNADLNIMEREQTLSKVTTNALKKLEKTLLNLRPDLVLIQGDTTTTFVTALAAYYQQIKIGHVEAGLRSEDKYQPFPEEINRRMISAISDLHFVPTDTAYQNLLREGVGEGSIFLTGNTVVDALLYITRDKYNFSQPSLKQLDFKRSKVIVVTAHRRESWGEPLRNICLALSKLARINPDVQIVFPVHRNPVVRGTVRKTIGRQNRIHLLDPLDYQTFAHLMKKCYLILTDSGGIQEEAPTFGKPVLVLREVTERPEGIKAGVAKLAGTSEDKIFKEAQKLIDLPSEYKKMARKTNPYGDGEAAKRIVKVIIKQSGTYKHRANS